MRKKIFKRWVILVFVIISFIVVISMISLQSKPAEGSGTCCFEMGSICIVGSNVFHDYYYKSSGSCKIVN